MEERQIKTSTEELARLCPVFFGFLNESVHDKASIQKLRELMREDGAIDYLMITGPGGSGKTMLELFIRSTSIFALPGIKSNIEVQSITTSSVRMDIQPPGMSIHLKKEVPGDDKDPCFLSKLKPEAWNFIKWALAEEL
ncbi:MAG: hypothetical protein K9L23_20060 [Desulfotignum sp.]|nr:hypothetical protein [Desulfotignum sp.]MCF8126861.1 hypothetical protein [Desulfotignum sp.]